MGLLDVPIRLALNRAKDSYINPALKGIGVVEEIAWKNGALRAVLRLKGLENEPVEVECADIRLAPDASFISIGSFVSNKEFATEALRRYVAGRSFTIPEGGARTAALAAKKILGL